ALMVVSPETLAARLAVDLAGILLQDLGEVGEAEVRGEKPPSLEDMIVDAGVQIVANRIFEGAILGGGRLSKGVDPGRLGEFEAKASTAVRRRVAEAEAPQVADAILAGRA